MNANLFAVLVVFAKAPFTSGCFSVVTMLVSGFHPSTSPSFNPFAYSSKVIGYLRKPQVWNSNLLFPRVSKIWAHPLVRTSSIFPFSLFPSLHHLHIQPLWLSQLCTNPHDLYLNLTFHSPSRLVQLKGYCTIHTVPLIS